MIRVGVPQRRNGKVHYARRWILFCPVVIRNVPKSGLCIEKDKKKQQCPWCGWNSKQKIPCFRFFYAPLSGQYREEGHCLTAWSGRTLHEWHVFTNKSPTAAADPKVLADVHFHGGKWLLINRALDDMMSATGRPVAPWSSGRADKW